MQIITIRLPTGETCFPYDIRGVARLYVEIKNPGFNFIQAINFNRTGTGIVATENEEQTALENLNIVNDFFNNTI